MSGSVAPVLGYLDEVDPEAAGVARERYGCLTPWQNEPATYGRAVLGGAHRTCEAAVVAQRKESDSLARRHEKLREAMAKAVGALDEIIAREDG